MWRAREKLLEERVEILEDKVAVLLEVKVAMEDKVVVLEGIVEKLPMSGECSVPITHSLSLSHTP
jgi:hypothetical protein